MTRGGSDKGGGDGGGERRDETLRYFSISPNFVCSQLKKLEAASTAFWVSSSDYMEQDYLRELSTNVKKYKDMLHVTEDWRKRVLAIDGLELEEEDKSPSVKEICEKGGLGTILFMLSYEPPKEDLGVEMIENPLGKSKKKRKPRKGSKKKTGGKSSKPLEEAGDEPFHPVEPFQGVDKPATKRKAKKLVMVMDDDD